MLSEKTKDGKQAAFTLWVKACRLVVWALGYRSEVSSNFEGKWLANNQVARIQAY